MPDDNVKALTDRGFSVPEWHGERRIARLNLPISGSTADTLIRELAALPLGLMIGRDCSAAFSVAQALQATGWVTLGWHLGDRYLQLKPGVKRRLSRATIRPFEIYDDGNRPPPVSADVTDEPDTTSGATRPRRRLRIDNDVLGAVLGRLVAAGGCRSFCISMLMRELSATRMAATKFLFQLEAAGYITLNSKQRPTVMGVGLTGAAWLAGHDTGGEVAWQILDEWSLTGVAPENPAVLIAEVAALMAGNEAAVEEIHRLRTDLARAVEQAAAQAGVPKVA